MDLAQRRLLRGYDAIQLSAALLVADAGRDAGITPIMVSADEHLNAAAEGLKAENAPNMHNIDFTAS